MPKTIAYEIDEAAASRLAIVASEANLQVDEVAKRALDFYASLSDVARIALSRFLEGGAPSDEPRRMRTISDRIIQCDLDAMALRLDTERRKLDADMAEISTTIRALGGKAMRASKTQGMDDKRGPSRETKPA